MTNNTPQILQIPAKKLVGISLEMSLADNKTFALFSSFMPNRDQITNAVNPDIYEVLYYNTSYFKSFNPNTVFTKWATLEVHDYQIIPKTMNTLDMEGGLYAVFTYKGLSKDFGKFMQNIFSQWLPHSGYQLDHRPHFNVLGNRYKNNHPDSEEDVYIPIKKTE